MISSSVASASRTCSSTASRITPSKAPEGIGRRSEVASAWIVDAGKTSRFSTFGP